MLNFIKTLVIKVKTYTRSCKTERTTLLLKKVAEVAEKVMIAAINFFKLLKKANVFFIAIADFMKAASTYVKTKGKEVLEKATLSAIEKMETCVDYLRKTILPQIAEFTKTASEFLSSVEDLCRSLAEWAVVADEVYDLRTTAATA